MSDQKKPIYMAFGVIILPSLFLLKMVESYDPDSFRLTLPFTRYFFKIILLPEKQ
jgi:hypothetical protein